MEAHERALQSAVGWKQCYKIGVQENSIFVDDAAVPGEEDGSFSESASLPQHFSPPDGPFIWVEEGHGDATFETSALPSSGQDDASHHPTSSQAKEEVAVTVTFVLLPRATEDAARVCPQVRAEAVSVTLVELTVIEVAAAVGHVAEAVLASLGVDLANVHTAIALVQRV